MCKWFVTYINTESCLSFTNTRILLFFLLRDIGSTNLPVVFLQNFLFASNLHNWGLTFPPALFWQDTLGGGFDATQAYVGELANLNIWNRKLSVNEIHNLATCNSRAPAGNVFSWTENNIEIFGGATKWTFEPCRSHNWTAGGKREKKRKKEKKRPLRISELLSFLSSFDVCTRRSELFIGKLKPGIYVIFFRYLCAKTTLVDYHLEGGWERKKKSMRKAFECEESNRGTSV